MEIFVMDLLRVNIYIVLCKPPSDNFFFSVLCILKEP